MRQRNLILRFVSRTLCVLAAACLMFALPVAPGVSGLSGIAPAAAQERPRNLLELIFPRRKEAKPPVQKAPRAAPSAKQRAAKPKAQAAPKKPARRVKSTASAPAAIASAPTVPTVEKSENARTVLVVGDFIAEGMAQGLEEAFQDVANVVITARTNGSSGFVRNDFYDWPNEITAIVQEVKPAIVVALLGSNDRQVMRVDGTSEEVLSPAWEQEYKARIEAFIKVVRDNGSILVWTGSPPFKFRSMTTDILAFNEIYRTTALNAGVFYVDIWDGFVDAEGNFVTTGTDIKGQPARLRASDGINFTSTGKRKIAFYVERQLKQILGDAASPLLTSLATDNLPMLQLPPLETEAGLERTNPIAMTDPEFDGGSTLLGDVTVEVDANPLQAKSFRQRLVEDGIPAPEKAGRSGNFRWPG